MCLSSLKTKETKKKQEQKIVGIRRRNHKQMEESKNKKNRTRKRERNKTENFKSMIFWGLRGCGNTTQLWIKKLLKQIICEDSKGSHTKQKSFFFKQTHGLI